jgi:hypothetical protein
MNQMEVIDRAERLARLQAYGTEQAASTGVTYEDAVAVVRRVLSQSS